jgi:hypothetical protein
VVHWCSTHIPISNRTSRMHSHQHVQRLKDNVLLLAETLSYRNTMAWCLFAISTHPEVEERVSAELDTLGLLAKPGYPEPRSLEVSDLGKLPYLNAAIKEAMRLHTVRIKRWLYCLSKKLHGSPSQTFQNCEWFCHCAHRTAFRQSSPTMISLPVCRIP